MITWEERKELETRRLGRSLTLDELLKLGAQHTMTPGEIEAQRESWVRAMKPTGDPRLD